MASNTTNTQLGSTFGVLRGVGGDPQHSRQNAEDDPGLIKNVDYFIPTEQAFLPKKIGDKLVMRQIYNNKFEATNEFLNSDDKGLYYKRSPSLNRPIPTREDGVAAFLPWGQSTYGVEEKDYIAIFALQQQSAPLSGQPLPLQDFPEVHGQPHAQGYGGS